MRFASVLLVLFSILEFACSSNTTGAENARKKPAADYPKAGVGLLALKRPTDSFLMYGDDQFRTYLGQFSLEEIARDPDLQPKYFDPEEDLCYFNCLGWNRRLYTVLMHEGQVDTAYIPMDSSKYRIVPMEYVLTHFTFTRRNPATNRARNRPSIYGKLLAWDSLPEDSVLIPKAVKNPFVRVFSPRDSAEGWVRWVHSDTLLLDIPRSYIKPWEAYMPFEDPAADPRFYH